MVQFTLRLLLLLALLFGIYQVVRRATASWFVHRANRAASRPGISSAIIADDLRRAMLMDAEDPRHPELLTRVLQYSLEGAESGEVLSLAQRAVTLAPHRAELRVELAGAYEWAGWQADAQQEFEHALSLFPRSPRINWQLANYSLRLDRIHEAAGYLRACIEHDASLRRPSFDLAWRATGDASYVLREVVPHTTPALLAYLDYLADTSRLDAAAAVWTLLRNDGLKFAPAVAFTYLNALRDARRIGELAAAWSALAARHPDKILRGGADGNLIVNGDFESEPLNGGLDWLIMEVPGVAARTVSSVSYSGGRSLEIRFNDCGDISYAHVVQFVPVQANTRYRFVAHVRTEGITSDRGPRIEVRDHFDPAALLVTLPDKLGTASWSGDAVEFTTGPVTSLLAVRVLRPQSGKFREFHGTFWLDDVSLVPLP